jgi:uracil phosphoribosyltransferase
VDSEKKLDAILDKVSKIEVEVAVNTADLKHHIARTDLLQKQVDSIWPKALMFVSILGAIITLLKAVL